MRQASIIIFAIIAILAAGLISAPKIFLHIAKSRAFKEFAEGRMMFNSIPQAGIKKIAPLTDSTNVIWVNVNKCSIGFPTAQFERDSDPKRADSIVHHTDYRIFVSASLNGKEFEPVMHPFGMTNFYEFVRSPYHATETDIVKQPDMNLLLRHSILLKTKATIAPVGFENSCIEFNRGDFSGFIMGEPIRNKHLCIQIFVPSENQFIDLVLTQNVHVQMSEIEKLLGGLQIHSSL